jgi:hypothetical protein
VTDQSLLPGRAREDVEINGTARYTDVEALAFAIVHALEDRDSGLIAEVRALRHEIAMLCEEVSNLGHIVLQERALPAALSASIQHAIGADLAKLIERLNSQSRAEQIVALREEVRAQLGELNSAAELVSLRLMVRTEQGGASRE